MHVTYKEGFMSVKPNDIRKVLDKDAPPGWTAFELEAVGGIKIPNKAQAAFTATNLSSAGGQHNAGYQIFEKSQADPTKFKKGDGKFVGNPHTPAR
jgi:hypothetical protein